jgi:putative tricarboxylic transport membrane protein
MSTEKEGAGESRLPLEQKTAGRDLAGLAIAGGLFALAVLIWWDASSYPARRSYAQFGPEIFPYLVAAGLVGFGFLTLRLAILSEFPARSEMSWRPVGWVVSAVVAEIALLSVGAGFILASGALFGLSARGMGRRPVWFTVLVGVCISALLYILFRHGLGLSLRGPLERLIDSPFRR